MKFNRISRCAPRVLLFYMLAVLGCDGPAAEHDSHARSAVAAATVETGPQTSSVAIDMSQGWCGGHGVPESVCTRCDADLIRQFKEGGDWCAEHGLPESQCDLCNPGVAARWVVLNAGEATPEVQDDRHQRMTTSDPTPGMTLERMPRTIDRRSDPLCQVDALRVRFVDQAVVRSAGIETAAARPRRISAAIDVPAEVAFDATRVTRVTPRAAGVVREVAARIGGVVEAGELLAVIDSHVLGEAKSMYIERHQTYLLAQGDHARVATIYEGEQRMLQIVTGDAAMDELRERLEGVPVGASKARLLRAHATLQLARAEAARETRLLEKKVGSERELQAAQSAQSAAEADFLAMREEIAFQSERDKLVAERGLETAAAARAAAERRLHILGLDAEQVQAIGTSPDTQLSRYELRSPVSGRVVEHGVSAGESVDITDVLFVLADNSVMWLMADVNARDLLLLHKETPVMFTVDGLPGVSFDGRVTWISSEVDHRTRTVRVRADLPNKSGLLRANMYGRARLLVRDDADVLSVPSGAVQTDGCCQLVFVREGDAVFAPRKVALGAGAGGYVEVLRGLKEGELVATTGSFLMKTEILKGNIGAGCCEVDPGR